MLVNVAVALTVGLLITGFIPSAYTFGWNYDGSDGELDPADWSYNYSMCAGTSQSPIDIITANTAQITGGLTFSGYDTAPASQNYTITNNGHSVTINVNVKTISLKNSQLNGTYVLEQFHFHWGVNDNNGSEHSVNGQFHPLEIHFVHYNSDKYNNVSHAASTNDSSALLVLGVFVDVADTNTSTALMSLADNYLSQVPYQNNVTSIAPFALNGLLPSLSQCQQSTIYSYSGSLTTPTCAQVVNWNIFAQPIYIPSTVLDKFRQVHGANPEEKLTHNARPRQQLNNRVVNSYTIKAPGTCNPVVNGAHLVHCSQLITLLGLACLRLMLLSD
jgi:carbonic anhydrase